MARTPRYLPTSGVAVASLVGSPIPALAVDNNLTPDASFTTVTTDASGVHHTVNVVNEAAKSVNVFNDFIVGTGHTVDLNVPRINGQDAMLVNIVRDSRPEIHGTLNSILQNNDIGGNVVFASSNGFLVGSTGIVNTGNLVVRTPTSGEMDKLLSSGAAVDSEITRLVNGEMSINDSATITIEGKVVTGSGITLDGGKIAIAESGILMAGDNYRATYGAAVNTGDYTAPTELQVEGGTIVLKASNGGSSSSPGIAVNGDLLADGGITIGVSTSQQEHLSVDVSQGAHIQLGSTSLLDTRDTNDAGALTNAGDITISAAAATDVNFAQATSEARVDLDGQIQAGALTVTANTDASAESKDLGSLATKTAIAGMTGVNFSYLEADADSIIEVGSTANIDTAGDIRMKADADSVARTNDVTLSNNGWSVATNYSRADATSQVVVQSGASVTTDGDLSLRADNEAYIEVAARNYVLKDSTDYALAVAVANANVDALAQIDSGVTLDADNLDLIATNQNYFQVKANISDYADEGTRGGFAVALGDFDTNARAVLGASIGTAADPVGDVRVISVNRTHRQQVAASVSVGASGAGQLVGQFAGTAVTSAGNSMQSWVSSKGQENASQDVNDNTQTDDSEENKVKWKAGSALAINLGDHDSYAFIGNTENSGTAPTIYSDGDVFVLAANDTYSWRTSAESSISAPKCEDGSSSGSGNNTSCSEKSYSFAINVAVEDLDTRAAIGENTVITADNVAVHASQRLPITQSYTEWQNLESITSQIYAIVSTADGKGGMVDNLLTNFANSSASAEDKSIGGTVNSTVVNIDTSAWIDDGVFITANGTGSDGTSVTLTVDAQLESTLSSDGANPVIDQQYNWNSGVDDSRRPDFYDSTGEKSDNTGNVFLNMENRNLPSDSVVVEAVNVVEDLSLMGNMGTLLIGPAGGTNQEGKSLGGAVSVEYFDVNTLAGIGDARINAQASGGSVGVYSDFKERHIVITPTSGSGKGFGFNGILNVLITDAVNHASVSNLAEITTETLEIAARHDVNNWTAAGAVVSSTPTAIGMALTGNFNNTGNKAYIGDNSGDRNKHDFPDGGSNPVPTPAPSAPAPVATNGTITSRTVRVKSTTTGMVGSVAAAGAYTSGAPRGESSGSYVSQAKDYLKDTSFVRGLAKFMPALATGTSTSVSGAASSGATGDSASSGDSVASSDTDTSGNPTNTDSTSTENQNKVNTGWTGAGSFTLAVTDIDSQAVIDGANIVSTSASDGALDVQGLSKITGVSASGAAGLTWSSGKDAAPDNTNNMAGAIAYQFSANDTRARIVDSTVIGADDVSVNAVHGGDRISIGLGLSITIDASKNEGETRNAGISFSGAAVEDTVQATIENSDITGTGWDDDLEVTAYNTTNVGVGGGAFYYGGTQGMGLAITVATIGNNVDSLAGQLNDSSEEEILAGIYDSTLTDFGDVDVSARNLSRIAIAAAGGGFGSQGSSADNNTKGFAGSFAISDIGVRSYAIFDNSQLVSSDAATGTTATLDVNSIGSRNGTLDTVLDGLGDSGVSADYDFSGEQDVLSSDAVHSDDTGNGGAISASSEGARIISVAGVFQGGSKQNVGISYIHSDIHNEHKALITGGSNITADSVAVAARDEALIYNIAMGLGVAKGNLAGVGSVSVAEVNNRTEARIGGWDGVSRSGQITAGDLSVQANNEADIFNLAGAVAFAAGENKSGNVGGLAATVTLIGNQQGHETSAYLANTDLDVDGNITVKALSGTSDDDNLLISNAIGVGIASSGQGIAFAGAVTTSNVDQSVHAAIKNVGDSGAINLTGSDDGGDLIVQARDDTFAVGTAWTLAGSSQGNALGVSVTTNRVDSDVTAEVLGDGTNAESTNLQLSDALIQAERDNRLLSIDAGVAVGDRLSGAGSVGTNVVDGNVTARIADKARIDAYNNIGVIAHAKTLSEAGSGAVGVGLNGAAGAVALATALEYGDTKAYIADAAVNASGKGGSLSAITGALSGDPTAPTFGEDGDSDNEKKASSVDVDATLDGFDSINLSEDTESVSGLLVQASSTVKQRSIDVAGALAAQTSVAINVATNATWGNTEAYIQNADVNQSIAATANTDVTVRSAHHAMGLAVSAGAAVGRSGGVGGFSTNHFSKTVKANILDSAISANDVRLGARQSNLSQAVSAGVGGGANYGGAASVVITVMKGSTQSWLKGGTLTSATLDVDADSIEDSAMASGALGLGQVGVGANLSINVLQNDTEAWIGQAPGSRDRTTDTVINTDTLTLDANRQIRVENWAFGAGGGTTGGGALMVGVTETGGHTRAGIYGMEDDVTSNVFTTRIQGQDGSSPSSSIDVNAQESTSAFTGALGIGGGGTLGVGAVANVLLQRSQVVAEVVGSHLTGSDISVNANSLRSSDLYNLSFGAGSGAISASIGVVMTGKGDGGDASQTFTDGYQSMTEGATDGDASYDNILTDAEKAEILSKRSSDFIISDVPDAAPTDPANHSGYSKDGSTLLLGDGNSATLAQISGGHIEAGDLTVRANAQHHNFSVIGAAQGSAAGVSGGFGFTRINEQVQALLDTDLDATNVSVSAAMGNVSDDDAAAEMLTIVAGIGGTAAGVAVTDVRSSNRVLAAVSQGVGAGGGTLSVMAEDTSELRVGDIDANFDSDGANDRINDAGTVNAQFGIAAVGVSYNHVEKNSDVDAWIGADGGTVAGFDTIYLDALSSGHVKAVGYGAVGGLKFGAQAVVAKAIDTSSARAVLAGDIWTNGSWDNANGTASGLVQVNAITTPEAIARSYGITVAGLGAVGGSFAYATAGTTAEVEVDSGTNFYFAANGGSGPADLNAVPVSLNAINGDPLDDDYESALALSFAASGGLLVGLTGSHAEAENTGVTRVRIEDYVNLPYNNLDVTALGIYRQRAESDGYFAGAVAGGASIAGAYSATTTEVLLGKDPMGSTRSGDLSLAALAETSDMAFSIAGGGGVVSGSAAEAHAGARDKSNGSGDDQYEDSTVQVVLSDWSSNQASVDAASLSLLAQSNHYFFAGTDSTTASVVGGSGASSSGQFSDTATVNIGDNVAFHADRMSVQAEANLNQYSTDQAGSIAHFNDRYHASVQAGSGGVLNGSASHSFVKAEDLDAVVNIGDNATLLVNVDDNTVYSDAIGNNLLINATSGFSISDQATLVVGGAFQGAGAESVVTINTDNAINVGNGAELRNDIDKLGLGVWSQGIATADASVSLYAAAGLAGAKGNATINANNRISVADNASLRSYGLLNVLAGRSGDYLSENTLYAKGLSNIYLGALIPVEGTKQAQGNVTSNNTITLGAADLLSVRDVFVEADQGAVWAEHKGVVKNLYDSIGLSSEETFGNSSKSGSALLQFTGDTHIEAGIYHEQTVEITSSGQVYVNGELTPISFSGEDGQVPESFSGRIFKPTEQYSAQEEMQGYLEALEAERTALIAELMAGETATGDPDSPTTEGDSGSGSSPGVSGLTQAEAEATAEVQALDGEIAFVSSVLSSLPSESNDQIVVTDVIAAGGDVNLRADSYTVAGNGPSIVANGDPLIQIKNYSNKTLVLANLEIPRSSGGNIVLEGGLSVSDLASVYGTANVSGSGGLIDVMHEPVSGEGHGDIAIQGLISNLGGTVDINAVTGSVIQTATIEARELAITVNTGTYLLNNPGSYQSYGFDPKSLTGYTQRFKPTTADDFVDYYVSSYYKSTWDNGNWDSAIDDGNDNHISFNEWFYGDYYDDDIDQNYSYNQDGERWGDRGTYAGRININVYKNWGFRDIEGGSDWYECSSNCVQFAMGAKKHGGSRGGGDGWKFTPIDDMRNSLVSTASYSDIYGAGYGDRGGNAISAQTVAINARYVDINGTIRAGNYNNWSVEVGDGFDAAMAQYVAAKGLTDGDQVVLTRGSQLSYQVQNANYDPSLPSWFPGNSRYTTTVVNPEISLVNRSNDDAGISLVYDVGSQRLQLNDVEASGNGFVTIRGRIMSTGENGRIQVDNGLGDIKVVNNSSTTLDVGNIDAGSTSAGVVRITDLNFSKRVNGQVVSQWYVHTPGGDIQTYVTSQNASSYTGATLSSGSISGNSATYDTAAGQVYWFKEEKRISRSDEHLFDSGWVAEYGGVGAGDTYGWVFEDQTTQWGDAPVASGVMTCQQAGISCDANGSANNYLTHELSADSGELRRKGMGWYATYNDYYGSEFTNNDYVIWVATQMGLDAYTYIKADHSIGVEFIGADAGKVDIQSVGDLHLTGNISNADGTTWLSSTGGSLTGNSEAVATSERAVLYAHDTIGTADQALRIQTDRLDAQSVNGAINLDLSAVNTGTIGIDRVWSGDDLTLVSQVGLINRGSQSIALQGNDMDLTLQQGGLGSVSIDNTTGAVTLTNLMTMDSNGVVTISSGDDGSGELEAVQGNLALQEVNGDLEVNQILANGDVYLDVSNGALVNANSRNDATAEELAYEEDIWSILGLNDDSFAVGQAQVQAYNAAVTGDYHRFHQLADRIEQVAAVADGTVAADKAAAEVAGDDTAVDGYLLIEGRVANDFAETLRLQTEEGLYQDYALGSEAAPDYVEYIRLLNDQQQTVADRLTGNGASDAPQAAGIDLMAGYDASFAYDLQTADSVHYTELLEGARWEDNQLEVSINSKAFDNTSSGSISNADRVATIAGVDVLVATASDLGSNDAQVAFSISRDNPNLDGSQKTALLNASVGDIYAVLNEDGSGNFQSIDLTINQVNTIKIDATGYQQLSGGGVVYVESELDQKLHLAQSGADMRLETEGQILHSGINPVTLVSGGDLNLAANNGIGALGDALTTRVSGVLKDASSLGDIHLFHDGDLVLGNLDAGSVLRLDVDGQLLNWDQGLAPEVDAALVGGHIGGADTWIRVAGNIGSADRHVVLKSSVEQLGIEHWDFGSDSAPGEVYDAYIDSRGDVLALDTLSVTGDLRLDADGAVTVLDTIAAGRALTFNAQSVASEVGSQWFSGNGMSLTADNGMQLNDVSAGTVLALSAGADLTLAGNVEANGGDLVVTAADELVISDGAALATSGVLSLAVGSLDAASSSTISADSIDLDAVGAATLAQLEAVNGIELAAGSLDLTGPVSSDTAAILALVDGNLTQSGTLSAQTGVSLTSLSGDMVINSDILVSDGNVALTTGLGDLAINTDLAVAQGNLNLSALGGNLVLASGRKLTASGDLVADAAGIDIAADSELQAANLALTGGSVSLGMASASDSLSLTAAGDLFAAGTLAAGSLDYQAGGLATFADGVQASVSLVGESTGTSEFRGPVSFGESGSLVAGGDLLMSGTVSGGALQLAAGGDLLAQGTIATGSLDFDAAGDVNLLKAVTTSANLAGSAGGSLTVDGVMTAGGDLSLSAGDVATFQRALTASGDLEVSSRGPMTLHDKVSGNRVALRSTDGGMVVHRQIVAGNDLSLLAGDTLLLKANVHADGDAVIAADRFTMGQGTRLTAQSVQVTTTGDQLINQIEVSGDSGRVIDLVAGGSIIGRRDLDTSSGKPHLKVAAGTGQTWLMAGTGIGVEEPLMVDLPWLSAITDTGQLSIFAISDLYAETLSVKDGGDLTVVALRDLEIGYLHGDAVIHTVANAVVPVSNTSTEELGVSSYRVTNLQTPEPVLTGLDSDNVLVNIGGRAGNPADLFAASLPLAGAGSESAQFYQTPELVDRLTFHARVGNSGYLTTYGYSLSLGDTDIGEILVFETMNGSGSVGDGSAVQLRSFQGLPYLLDAQDVVMRRLDGDERDDAEPAGEQGLRSSVFPAIPI